MSCKIQENQAKWKMRERMKEEKCKAYKLDGREVAQGRGRVEDEGKAIITLWMAYEVAEGRERVENEGKATVSLFQSLSLWLPFSC